MSPFSFPVALPAVLVLLLSAPPAVAVEQGSWEQRLQQAYQQLADGNTEAGGALLDGLLTERPESRQALEMRVGLALGQKDFAQAAVDLDVLLKMSEPTLSLLHSRGVVAFNLGEFAASVAWFDQEIARDPARDPHHWQRGLSLYYARRYADGAAQFERHQTVNGHDVENAVWHFLCRCRADGLAAAQAQLLPITGDRRIPMMQIHALFAGRASVAEVLAAVEQGQPSPANRRQRLFYAHLYIALYHEAHGDREACRQHLTTAVRDYPHAGYMGDLARVHLRTLAASD